YALPIYVQIAIERATFARAHFDRGARHHIPPFAAAGLLSDQSRHSVGQYAFSFFRNPADNLGSWRDIVNEAGILTHRQDRLVDVAILARRLQCCPGLGPVLAQCPFPPCPSLYEPVAPRT